MDDNLKQYLIIAGAILLVLILFIIIYYIFKKTQTFSIVFPVSKPNNNGKSTLPGIGDNAVSDGKSTFVELKKKTIGSLNVVTLENESGLI